MSSTTVHHTQDQDVPLGYKRTEVGVIPEDWSITYLGDLGKCLSGGTPRMSEFRYWGGEIPWVSSKDMKSLRICDSIDHVTEMAIGNGTRLVQSGTVLIVVRGMSLVHSLPVAIVEKPLTFNQDIKAFIARPDISNEFLLRWLEANETRLLLLATESTHGTKRLPTLDLLSSQVVLPPLAEQRAIAAALSDVDALLAALDALIAKKRAIKQATMQQLLTGATRLPGFSGAWREVKLGEVSDIKTGERNNQDKVQDGAYPFFVRSANIERIDTFTYDCEAILIPGEGGIGSIFHYINGQFDVHQRVYKISDFNLHIHGKYVFYNMTAFFGVYAMNNTVKATVDSLRLPTFRNYTFQVSSDFEEQAAIAAVLSDMDAEIEALERRREKTQQIKQGMMQQLLTGRIRLVHAT